MQNGTVSWAEISAEPNGDFHRVSVDIELKNTAPMDLPAYVSGPYPRSGLEAGEYLGIVALTVPKGAGNFSVDGAEAGFIAGDGPTRVVTVPVRIPLGESAEFTVSFDLTDAWSSIVVQPSARVPPTSWAAGELEWKDISPQPLDLEVLAR